MAGPPSVMSPPSESSLETEAGLPAPDSPLYRVWVMLLEGWGFNWYRLKSQLRADELLIRSRTSDQLATAAALLRDLETAFRRRYLAPASRQNSFPERRRLE